MTGRWGDIKGPQAQPAQEDINASHLHSYGQFLSHSLLLRSPFPSYTKALSLLKDSRYSHVQEQSYKPITVESVAEQIFSDVINSFCPADATRGTTHSL